MEVGIITPILQMKKLRLGKVYFFFLQKQLLWILNHTAHIYHLRFRGKPDMAE